jgi:outer membrane lipoprotein-sorting protein
MTTAASSVAGGLTGVGPVRGQVDEHPLGGQIVLARRPRRGSSAATEVAQAEACHGGSRLARPLMLLSGWWVQDGHMSIFGRTPALRWVVPAVTAVTLVSGGAAVGGLHASADSGLPARSAAQLIADVQQAHLEGLSGTVVEQADLGLPDLPVAGISGGAGSSDLTSLASGTHTMRVWSAGPDLTRVALLGTLGESDVVRNGTGVWVWASQDRTATHYVLPTLSKGADDQRRTVPGIAGDLPTSPQAVAEQVLAAITPSTQVMTSGTATVAGRSAYEIVLRPREATSLVAQVRVAIDGTEHVPLRVQVFAKSVADPVFEVAFSAVDFARPDPAQFTFKAPPGTTVTEAKAAADRNPAGATSKAEAAAPRPNLADLPRVVGKGWASVLVAKLPAAGAGMGRSTGATADKGLDQLMKVVGLLPRVSGSWGSGHLMAGTVFSVLLTDDGRLVVGAVTPKGLYAALAAS